MLKTSVRLLLLPPKGKVQVVRDLLATNIDPNSVYDDKQPLFVAAHFGLHDMADILLKRMSSGKVASNKGMAT